MPTRVLAMSLGIGALICIGFGMFWAILGMMALSGTFALLTAIAMSGVVALLLTAAFRLLLHLRRLPYQSSAAVQARRKRIFRGYVIINVVQWSTILGATSWLSATGRPEYMLPVVSLIIGLHFVALAPLFRFSVDYGIGALLCILAVGTVIVVPNTGTAWTAVIGIGNALVLWVGAAARLYQGRLAVTN